MKLLRSIPGVGILTGIKILVELQDFARFKTSEQIASYIGLTPSEYSTGQYVHQGRITRSGNTRVRVALVESSWILVGRDPLIGAQAPETQKYERRQEGDCRHSPKAHYQNTSDAFA